MALSKTFAVGELLTAEDVNAHLVNVVPNPGDPYLTDATPITLTPTAGGALYARRIGPMAILMFEGVSTSSGTAIAELPPEFQPGGGSPNPRGVLATTGTDPVVARVLVSTTVTLFGYIAGTAYYGSVTYPVV